MLIHHGGQWVRGGTYVGLTSGELVSIPGEGGILPGSGTRYLRMPLAVLAAPLLGLLFIIFLPFIGIVLVGWLVVYRAGRSLRAMSRGVSQAAIPGWRPGEAHLARGGRHKRAEGEKLAALEREVESRRGQEKEDSA